MKKKKFILQLLCCFFLGSILMVPVLAEENTVSEETINIQCTLMVTTEQTNLRMKPSSNAKVTAQLPEKTHVLATGSEENGWYEIYYQGEYVFVLAEDLIPAALDGEALDKEMQKVAEEDSEFIESLEIQRKAITRSKIWSIIIGVLIAVMFITGIVSALKKGKKESIGNGEK